MTLNMSLYGVQVSAAASGRIALTIGTASASLSPKEFAVLLDLFGGLAELARRASEAQGSLAGEAGVAAPVPVRSRQAEAQVERVQAPAPEIVPVAAIEPVRAPTPVREEAKPHVQAPVAKAVPAKPVPVKAAPAKAPAAAVAKPGRPRSDAKPEALAEFVADRTAAAATVASADRSKPGRPRVGYVPGTAPVSFPSKDTSSGKPGRPRQDGLGQEYAGIGLNKAKPVETDAKGKPKPGRARLDGASAEAIAVAAAARPSQLVKAGRKKSAASAEKRKPGRPRKDPPAEAVRTSSARLVDLVDQWMTETPGAKTLDEMIEAALKGRWLADSTSAEQQIKTTIPRHRDMFVLTADGKFLRRAEVETRKVSAKPVRRPRSETPVAS